MQTIFVNTKEEGIEKAKEILYEKLDAETLLFLSGGSSPKSLYESLAKEKRLRAGAVAMVDERYALPAGRQGEPMHEKSNEKMIKETGLLDYLTEKQIPWYPILPAGRQVLRRGLSREQTAEKYEEQIKDLFEKFPKRVAIMSIGADGHTAGLPAQISNVKCQISNFKWVMDYNDITGSFGERITLTFAALEQMDFFLLWVFGDEKKEALKKILNKREASSVKRKESEEEIPGRFYTRPEISEKTILITDQKI